MIQITAVSSMKVVFLGDAGLVGPSLFNYPGIGDWFREENYEPPMNVPLCYVNKREQNLIIVHCFPASFHSHIALGKHGKEEREQPCRTIPSFPAVPSKGSCKRVASMMTHVFWRPCRFQRGGNEGRKWKLLRLRLIKIGQERAVLKQVLLFDRLACKFVNLVNSFLRPRCPY